MALQDKRIMPPPWLAHREIERYSIGWRMGYGEDYIYRFEDWLDALSPEAQDPMKWRGQNLLGFALMEVRDELRRVTQNETLCDWNSVWEEEH